MLCLPAEISSKDVEKLFSGQEGMEDTAISTIDHVALVRRPPIHLTVNESNEQKVIIAFSFKMWKS